MEGEDWLREGGIDDKHVHIQHRSSVGKKGRVSYTRKQLESGKLVNNELN